MMPVWVRGCDRCGRFCRRVGSSRVGSAVNSRMSVVPLKMVMCSPSRMAVAVVSAPAQADVDPVGRNEQVAREFADDVAADEDWCREGSVGGAGLGGGGERLGRSGPGSAR